MNDAYLEKIRGDFSLLQSRVEGKEPSIFLNNAVSYLKPCFVLESAARYQERQSEEPPMIEEVRHKVQSFIGAQFLEEIIFTKSSSESAYLLAQGLAHELEPGDEVILSPHEYLSTLSAWQRVAKERKLKILIPRLQRNKSFEVKEYASLFSHKTKIVCLNHISSYLGSRVDIKKMTRIAHEKGAIVIIDGSQSTGHIPVDVQDLDADFFYFSGYKLMALSGIGVLYGRRELLQRVIPLVSGFGTLSSISYSKYELTSLPNRLEVSPQNVPAIISLGASIDYIQHIGGMQWIEQSEKKMFTYAKEILESISGLHILDFSEEHLAFIAFTVDGFLARGLQKILEEKGVVIGTKSRGELPDEFLSFYHVEGYLRLSLAFYNNKGDIDRLKESILEAQREAVSKVFHLDRISLALSHKEMIRFDSPNLSDNHIGVKRAALRPGRKSGPQLSLTEVDGKMVQHHFGHGGSGFTLGPYTADLVVNQCQAELETPITVLGAGIIGLLTAKELLRRGYRHITVIAERIYDIISTEASGHFSPMFLTDPVDPLHKLFQEGVRFGANFWGGRENVLRGVRRVPLLSERLADHPTAIYMNELFQLREVIVDFGSTKKSMHMVEDYIVYDPMMVLADLRKYLFERGIAIKPQKIEQFRDVEDSYIFNCTAWGAQELLDNSGLRPILGHHVYLKNQQGLNLNYVIDQSGLEFVPKIHPESKDIYDYGMLGYSAFFDEYNREAHDDEYEKMIQRAKDFFMYR